MNHRPAAPSVAPIHNHEPSWWLRTRLADLHTRWDTGQVLACRHIIGGAQDGRAALWLPRVFTCGQCVAVFDLDDRAARVCDRCDRDDPLTRRLVWREAGVLVAFRLCSGCLSREVPS